MDGLDPSHMLARMMRINVYSDHAHMELLHCPICKNRYAGTVLCTHETMEIAKIRNRDIQNSIQHYDGTEMIDSGHILGGRGLLFDDVFYTGDICTRDRPGITGANIPKCRTLIMECTFGMPQFRFPPIDEIVEKTNQAISEMYSRGIPVILMGYEVTYQNPH